MSIYTRPEHHAAPTSETDVFICHENMTPQEASRRALLTFGGSIGINMTAATQAKLGPIATKIEYDPDRPMAKKVAMLHGRLKVATAEQSQLNADIAIAEKRHFDALSQPDEKELEAARQAVLTLAHKRDVTRDELGILQKLVSEATAEMKKESEATIPGIQSALLREAEDAHAVALGQLMSIVNDTAFQTAIRQLLESALVSTMCANSPKIFKRHLQSFMTTGGLAHP